MNFFCDKTEINSVISQVVKTLSSKAAIPALEGIYIEAKGDNCKLIGGNGQLTIEASFKADVKEEGFALVPGRIFSDIIRRCYEGDVEILTDTSMTIISGKSRATIGMMDADSYPMTELSGNSWEFEMENTELKEAVKGSIFCAAGENFSKPILTGVYIEAEDDFISFVSIDGCRMAIKRASSKGEKGKLVIPAKALDEISKSIGDDGSSIITVYEKYVKVVWKDVSIISTLFDEKEYVNFKDILPKEHKVKIKVEKSKLFSSIERGSILSRVKQNNLLVLNIDKDLMTITARSDIGELYDEIDIWQEGEPLRIGFNGSFLSDCFRNISDEFIYIEFGGDRSPCIVKPCEGDGFLYMILPIQIS